MFSTKIVALFGLAAAVAVHAQGGGDPAANISECVIDCVTNAVMANGCAKYVHVPHKKNSD
jgi:hypothetical protein